MSSRRKLGGEFVSEGELDEETPRVMPPPGPRKSRKEWGLGGPGRIELPRVDRDIHIIQFFDLHGEYMEKPLFSAALQVLSETNPDVVLLGGDAINFDIISRWQETKRLKLKAGELYDLVKDEIDAFHNDIVNPIRRCTRAKLYLVEGNHDDRLRKWLHDDLQKGWLMAQDWLRADRLDGYFTRAGVYLFDDYIASHGKFTGQNLAKREAVDAGCGGSSGHDHTKDLHFLKPIPERGLAAEYAKAPCMCRTDANYGHGNAGHMRWHQGILGVMVDGGDHRSYQHDFGVWNGTYLRYQGKRYYP